MNNKDKIILDLCGGTGSWSKPYKEAGYDVRLITLPEGNVLTYQPPADVWGILAAPPCTEFSVSGVHWWKSKPPELLIEAIKVVRACLKIINECNPTWWALENPVGRLRRCVPELGEWKYTFQPYDYGDPWTKRTCIWGEHNRPVKNPVEPIGCIVNSHGKDRLPNIVDHPEILEGKYPSWTRSDRSGGRLGLVDHPKYLPPDWIHKLPPSADRATLRSITPSGFAKAFYEANP